MTRPTVLCLAILLTGACDRPAGPDAGTVLLTPDSVYVVTIRANAYEVEIPYTFVNLSSAAIQLPGCRGVYPPVLQRWDEGRWRTVTAPIYLFCYSAVIVGAGRSYSGVLDVRAGLPGGVTWPIWDFAVDGTYRLDWSVNEVYENPAGELVRARTERVSEPFRLVLDG